MAETQSVIPIIRDADRGRVLSDMQAAIDGIVAGEPVNLVALGPFGADPLLGDGAGILIQIPDAFLREEMAKQGVTLPPSGDEAMHIDRCDPR